MRAMLKQTEAGGLVAGSPAFIIKMEQTCFQRGCGLGIGGDLTAVEVEWYRLQKIIPI